MARAVAVAVEQAPTVVLDDEYRIVECNQAARPWFGHILGRNVFECFPGSCNLFRPYYEKARATGQCVMFAQYFDGYVTREHITPCGSRLMVTWETLAILDTATTDRLLASLDQAIERLDEEIRELERDRTKRSLRVVSGGA